MELKDLLNDLSYQHGEKLTMPTSNLFNTNVSADDIFRYAKHLNYGELHFKMDAHTGLFAIVAIHNTKLGSAIGGTRCISYANTHAAIIDALRLAQMMSYKAAICGLPHGGAKSVLMKPSVIENRQAYFESFGHFVNDLNGRYVAAMDSGTDVNDMDYIANTTHFVTCTSKVGSGDPAPYTALGVRRGIEAAVKFKMGKDNLNDIHIAIQGAGHVGYYLAKELSQLGARLTMADINKDHLARCQREFGVALVSPEDIYQLKCDVFAPCALGAIINSNTIGRLNTKIVVGSANNQLADPRLDDQFLFERGILYAPDFLVNAGGLIQAAASYDHGDINQAIEQIKNLYTETMNIFERAAKENKPTHFIAEVIAQERLQ